MKYIVITSKHHDGFALYDSKVSAYDVVDATPFKRDILKELAAACAKRGIRLGFYYSQAQDWHDPNGAGNDWDFGPDEKKDFDKYLREKGRAAGARAADRLRSGRAHLVRHAAHDERGAREALHRSRAHAAARDAHRRPPRHGRRLRDHRRQRDSARRCSTTPGKCRPPSITPGATSTTISTGNRPDRSRSSWWTSSARAATTCSTSGRWRMA